MEKDSDNEKLQPKALTMDIVKWMNYVGFNPFERTLKKQFIGYIYVFLSALLVILLALNFAFTPHDTISSLLEDSVMFFGFMQMGAKYFTGIRKSEFLANMLNSIWHDFWPTADFEEKKKYLMFYRRAKYIGNIYGMIGVFGIALVVIQAWAQSDRTLVMEIWIPNKEILKTSPYYEIMFVFQTFFFSMSALFSMVLLDRMFIFLTCFVFVQQKMIQSKIRAIKPTNTKNENWNIMRKCVIHHNILFRFLENFEEAYSTLLLPTVATTFIIISFCMYGAIHDDLINQKINYAFTYLSAMGQLFAFCFAGHLIQEEGLKIGEAVYNNIEWYEINDEELKMALMLMNLRSQRKTELTAGGIMILSIETFAAVVRATFTFLTFIVNMRE